MVFDPLNKNVSPMVLGTVHDGKITYRAATMEAPAHNAAAGSIPPPAQPSIQYPPPYARVGEEGVTYLGPHQADLPSGSVNIVLFGPNADTVAHSAAIRAALGNQAWTVIPVASDQNWGAATTQLVHALEDQHALAIIALDRDAAHLAEQLALKTFVPVVALANDKTLTSTNVPWIFRLPATGNEEAGAADAARLLTAAIQTSGNNPERLRAVLASGNTIAGMRFQPTGEPAP
jgi:phosphoribosylcarboxyaminoimidazole (NCAIR) mutase